MITIIGVYADKKMTNRRFHRLSFPWFGTNGKKRIRKKLSLTPQREVSDGTKPAFRVKTSSFPGKRRYILPERRKHFRKTLTSFSNFSECFVRSHLLLWKTKPSENFSTLVALRKTLPSEYPKNRHLPQRSTKWINGADSSYQNASKSICLKEKR